MLTSQKSIHSRAVLCLLASLLAIVLACRTPSRQLTQPGDDQPINLYSGPARQLSFLFGGNVWLFSLPEGNLVQLTETGDVRRYTWSSDGNRLATFNGEDVCLLQMPDNPIHPENTPKGHSEASVFCIGPVATHIDYLEATQLIWSPDQNHLVVAAPGKWLIIFLEQIDTSVYLQDPPNWGVDLLPEIPGYSQAGSPLFLRDSSLVGTFTHDAYCGSAGCTYASYRFDYGSMSFSPFPLTGSTEVDMGENFSASSDGNVVVNFGSSHSGCESFSTYVSLTYLDSGTTQSFHIDQQSFYGIGLSPDGAYGVIARGTGCETEGQENWAANCELSDGYEVFPMQLWKMETSNPLMDLQPGTNPTWSPDGNTIAFRSCLKQTSPGLFEPTSTGPPWIFVMDATGNFAVPEPVHMGSDPAWRP